MTSGKDLIGKMVVSTAEGKLLGKVKDIYLDKELTQISGIYLGAEGFLSRRPLLVARDDIQLFGEDALLVRRADSVVAADQTPNASAWVRLSELEGRAVDTSGGTKVGILGDVKLSATGDVNGFTLSRVLLEGPIAQSRTVMRTAVIDTGAIDGTMTIDLAQTEKVAQEIAQLATQATPAATGTNELTPEAATPESDEPGLKMDISDSSPM